MPNVSDFLQPGAQYTLTFEPVSNPSWLDYFTLNPSAFASYLEHPDVGALNTSLLSIGILSSPSLTVQAPIQLGGTDFYNVTFIYAGDGSDVAASAIQAILDAFDQATAVSWNFVGFGVVQQNQTGSGLGLPSLNLGSSMWAIVVLVILGAFLFYGGGAGVASAAKRVL